MARISQLPTGTPLSTEVLPYSTSSTTKKATFASLPISDATQVALNAKGVGTVTAVSVATANGVSGSSSGGATPALTIALGAITPSTVNGNTITTGTGTITITGTKTLTVANTASVSGTNTGDNVAASTSVAGLAPQATAPASGLYNYVGITNGETAYTNKALFDATAPSTQAFGDSADAGSAAVAARRDHKHAMPPAPTSVSGNAGTVTNGVYTTSQVTVMAATAVGDKNKYLHSNSSTGALEWSTVSAGSTEGTAVLSTGEVGGTKFLREDGDGTCSWQTPAGSGDMLLGTVQAVTAEKKFTNDKITLLGSSTGKTILHSNNASATDYTANLQAGNGTLAYQADTHYIGTTSVALNRGSAALTLAGITLTTPDIGTPSAGTLTNCTGLPIAGLTASTATALGVGSIELGHASDCTIARVGAGQISVETVNVMTVGSTDTVTGVKTMSNITLPTNGQVKLTVPTSDGHATGHTTADFNSGYTSSAIGDLVYLDSSSTWQKCDANTVALYNGLLGIALAAVASGNPLLVALPGSFVYATGFPVLTVGSPLYMSETAGAITHTAPVTADSATRVIGHAIHADKIYFNPDNVYITHT